ncbi:MAG: acyl-ACP--UDP-N-acetylglucosamine O-acyltransferase [Candidatus Omnitrophica bacterium]|nr:acyl-ACP--UDP-N-acetylglucosamine O-acyltransferase [Candidatus Omnitrophota bacterium]
MDIHKTAIVDKQAQLTDDVEIGPYCFIGPDVKIASGSRIGAHAVIEGHTSIGKNCKIFTGACLGSIPQDLKYQGEKTYLEIGENNIFREYVTVNLGTESGSKTVIGKNNLLMAYSHVAHDCIVGDECIIANCGTLAGHVTIQDKAVIGGLVAVHQFVTVGRLSIIGGCSKVVQDIPPFSTCDGHPTRVYGINMVGLKRNGVSQEEIMQLKKSFKILFMSKLSFPHAIEKVKAQIRVSQSISYLIDFIKNSKRGVCR